MNQQPQDITGAEVRLKYRVPSDQREAARAVASVIRDTWLKAGAVSVKLEEDVVTEKRARAPEVARAVTAAEKLAAFWLSKGFDPGARREALIAKAQLLEQECSDGKPRGSTAPVRLERVKFLNVGPFQDLEIDFEALGEDARLVAIRGVNGIGKTFTVETAIAGAAYRKMPTHGTLVGRARARDSLVEATLRTDRRYTIRHSLDAVSRKGEAVVLDESGAPVYEGTSVKTFDRWAAQHLPSADVLFSTSFASQKSEGFVALGSAERIQLIMTLVGVAWLERVAKLARENASKANAELDTAEARLADERARAGDVAALDAQLEAARLDWSAAESAADLAGNELRAAEAQLQRHQEAARAAEAVRAERAKLQGLVDAARAKVDDLAERVANNRALAAKGPEIRAAVERLKRVELVLKTIDGSFYANGVELTAAGAAERSAQDLVTAAERDIQAAHQRGARASARLNDAGAVERAAAEVPELQASVLELGAAAQNCIYDLERWRDKRLASAGDRIDALRQGLADIRDLGDGGGGGEDVEDPGAAASLANATIERDDEAVALAEEQPAEVRAAETALRTAQDRLAAAQRKLADAERQAARGPEMAAATAEVDEALKVEDDATGRKRSAEADRGLATMRLGKARLEAEQLNERAKELAAERAKIAPLAAEAESLARVEERLALREPQLAEARAELAQAEQNLSAVPAPEADTSPAPVLAGFQERVAAAQREARERHAAIAVCQERLEAARAGAARLVSFEADRDRAADELTDWNRLALDFGRDGLQSIEVDSAGPELTESCNDLLRSCHGSRFTVSIDTSRLSSDGKDQIDECRVQVIDTVAGDEREAREFSGGERTIISEALYGALTILACRRADLTGATLVRDESGAALDDMNRPAYVRMLRRVGELVGASRTLFITHDQDSAEMCDARILLAEGKASYS